MRMLENLDISNNSLKHFPNPNTNISKFSSPSKPAPKMSSIASGISSPKKVVINWEPVQASKTTSSFRI